jgi:uncharacterized spore protein YtfJ
MNASDLLQRLGELFGSAATVKSVFGEPIHTNGKTVVPVAKVAYGFGAGFGTGRHGPHMDSQGEGGGGGGGVRAFPAGALEITDQGTRFVPFRARGSCHSLIRCGLRLRARRLRYWVL